MLLYKYDWIIIYNSSKHPTTQLFTATNGMLHLYPYDNLNIFYCQLEQLFDTIFQDL